MSLHSTLVASNLLQAHLLLVNVQLVGVLVAQRSLELRRHPRDDLQVGILRTEHPLQVVVLAVGSFRTETKQVVCADLLEVIVFELAVELSEFAKPAFVVGAHLTFPRVVVDAPMIVCRVLVHAGFVGTHGIFLPILTNWHLRLIVGMQKITFFASRAFLF